MRYNFQLECVTVSLARGSKQTFRQWGNVPWHYISLASLDIMDTITMYGLK